MFFAGYEQNDSNNINVFQCVARQFPVHPNRELIHVNREGNCMEQGRTSGPRGRASMSLQNRRAALVRTNRAGHQGAGSVEATALVVGALRGGRTGGRGRGRQAAHESGCRPPNAPRARRLRQGVCRLPAPASMCAPGRGCGAGLGLARANACRRGFWSLPRVVAAQRVRRASGMQTQVVLSHIRAAPSARLCHLAFEGQGAFSSQC